MTQPLLLDAPAIETPIPHRSLRNIDNWTQADFDWFLMRKPRTFRYLDSGAYGKVYRIGRGLVMKLGDVTPDEADRLRYMASQEVAVPVYHFQFVTAGFFHRTQCNTCNRQYGNTRGKCDYEVGCLIMAEARDLPNHVWKRSQELRSFRDYTDALLQEKFSWHWDNESRHVMWYKGHMVAVDLGDYGH